MEKKVSVIIPSYNSESSIVKCINSIKNQSYKNIEIIIINDGSSDNTDTLCKEMVLSEPRIKYFKQENKGVSASRNKGLELCTGEFILFVDSDDWIDRTTISTLVNLQNQYRVDMVLFKIVTLKTKIEKLSIQCYQNKEELYEVLPFLIKSEIINSPCNKLYKKCILENFKFNEKINIGEDALLNYEVFFNIDSLCLTNYPFYHYESINETSLTKKYNSKKINMLLKVNDELNKLVEENGNKDEMIAASRYIRIKNIYSCLNDIFKNKELFEKNDKKNKIQDILSKSKLSKEKYRIRDFRMIILEKILLTNNENYIYLVAFFIYKLKNRKQY